MHIFKVGKNTNQLSMSGSPPPTVSSQKAGSTLLGPLFLELEVGNALNYEKGFEKAWNRNSSFPLLTPLFPKHSQPWSPCPQNIS